jgi:hypothetical protein
MEQEIDFSGVGAHHQNGVAERGIRTVTEWSRTMLLHAMLHWPDEVSLDLWPFALDHAIYLWNHLPREDTGLSPIEMYTGQVFVNYDFLLSVQVFGCPAYVLDPKLQDGKKLPKWVPRTRRGQYLGISTRHSSTIGRIRNIVTGNVSPQFHVVYDPFFTTVPTAGDPELVDVDRINLDALLTVGNGQREFNQVEEFDELGNAEPASELTTEWLTFCEREVRQRRRERLAPLPGVRIRRRRRIPPPPAGRRMDGVDGIDPPNPDHNDDANNNVDVDIENADFHDDLCLPPAAARDEDAIRDDDEASTDSDESSIPATATADGGNSSDDDDDEPPPLLLRRSLRKKRRNQNTYGGKGGVGLSKASNYDKRKIKEADVNNAFLNSLDWVATLSAIQSTNSRDYDRFAAQVEWEFDDCHPLALTMKANSMDTPNWNQAMNGLESDGYWQAMELEMETLLGKEAWIEVDREDHMNVLPSTWAFKCKRFPDGLVRKLKARFCVRGDCQIENLDVFDTYAPVVSWTTVRLLLILSVVLSLSTQQVDYTAAFVQALLSEDERVYVEMP